MPHPLTACVLVGVGGCAGSLARYGLILAAQRWSFGWPAGTLASNLLGCFLIGLLAEIAARGEAVSPEARLLLATGFCGGFTTLSSLVYELVQMMRDGEWVYSGVYFALTFAGAVIAFGLGALAMKAIIRM